jgi:hypothetical protein
VVLVKLTDYLVKEGEVESSRRVLENWKVGYRTGGTLLGIVTFMAVALLTVGRAMFSFFGALDIHHRAPQRVCG